MTNESDLKSGKIYKKKMFVSFGPIVSNYSIHVLR